MKPILKYLQFHLLTATALLFAAVPAFSQIAGIGILKADNSLTIWFDDETLISGRSYKLSDYPQSNIRFVLPQGKTARDIVGMSYSSTNKTYAWYSDLTFSSGYDPHDITTRPAAYTLPPGKMPADIAGIAINANDQVYTWYTDHTVSIGSVSNLGSIQQPVSYSLPGGASPNNIIDMEMRGNDVVYTWLLDGTKLRGTYRDLAHDAEPVHQETTNVVYDPSGNRYDKIRLGDLYWTKQNLNYATASGSWYYDNNAANGALYGRLYTWQAATQACAALGPGWRLPSDAEWNTLGRYWGGQQEAYGDLIENGRSGFSVRLGGARYDNGNYFGLNFFARFWSASQHNAGNNMAWAYSFYSSNRTFVRHEVYQLGGLSCRCVHE